MAGSSWLPDEEIFIKYFNEHRDWKLIIAPHVIGEDHLQQIEKLLEGRKVIRYTEAAKTDSQLSTVNCPLGSAASLCEELSTFEVLIIDCFGLLSSIYRYGQVAYVGGGFGVGIHNLPEAAVWDIPVFFGPNNERFQEAQELKQNGGGLEIHNYEEFAAQTWGGRRWLCQRKCRSNRNYLTAVANHPLTLAFVTSLCEELQLSIVNSFYSLSLYQSI